jgi:hypothetical protein
MHITYDRNREPTVNDAMALKAAVDPMLISDRRIVNSAVARTALTGILEFGLIWAKKPEKGKARSRPNAKICRELVARMLMALQTSRMRRIQANPEVVLIEPVAFRYPEIKEKPVGASSTLAKSPMVKRKVINMMKPKLPLSSAVVSMHHGTIFDASLISSACDKVSQGYEHKNQKKKKKKKNSKRIIPI